MKPLPYLSGMKSKAKGINSVRNKLLIHPEKQKDQILMISYSWDKDGPKFKNVRHLGQDFGFRDEGLWKNAQEFKDDFEELLNKAIAL